MIQLHMLKLIVGTRQGLSATCFLLMRTTTVEHYYNYNSSKSPFNMDLRRERKCLLKVCEQQQAELERIQAIRKGTVIMCVEEIIH